MCCGPTRDSGGPQPSIRARTGAHQRTRSSRRWRERGKLAAHRAPNPLSHRRGCGAQRHGTRLSLSGSGRAEPQRGHRHRGSVAVQAGALLRGGAADLRIVRLEQQSLTAMRLLVAAQLGRDLGGSTSACQPQEQWQRRRPCGRTAGRSPTVASKTQNRRRILPTRESRVPRAEHGAGVTTGPRTPVTAPSPRGRGARCAGPIWHSGHSRLDFLGAQRVAVARHSRSRHECVRTFLCGHADPFSAFR